MISPGISLIRLRRLPCWSRLQGLFTEWQQRIRSRYELERLNERDLADMKLTRLDASTRRRNRSGRFSAASSRSAVDDDADREKRMVLAAGAFRPPAVGVTDACPLLPCAVLISSFRFQP